MTSDGKGAAKVVNTRLSFAGSRRVEVDVIAMEIALVKSHSGSPTSRPNQRYQLGLACFWNQSLTPTEQQKAAFTVT